MDRENESYESQIARLSEQWKTQGECGDSWENEAEILSVRIAFYQILALMVL
jgi:hypothetical protein